MFEILVKDVDGSGKLLPVFNGLEDAGLDLFSVEDVNIYGGEWKAIRIGIATAFPAHMVAIIKDRSSMAGKGLTTLGGVIDSSYRGEWKVILLNVSSCMYTIRRGDRIAQAIFTSCLHPTVKMVKSLPDSIRGTGGFGSTGT